MSNQIIAIVAFRLTFDIFSSCTTRKQSFVLAIQFLTGNLNMDSSVFNSINNFGPIKDENYEIFRQAWVRHTTKKVVPDILLSNNST